MALGSPRRLPKLAPRDCGKSAATSSKANNFNLNVVDLALDKPIDETPWAAGYHVELWFGQDATSLGSSGQNSLLNNNGGGALGNDVAIRQACIVLRTPVGNGIDWKIGVFDSIIGDQSTSPPLNPNYTHSYGYSMEPTTFTGLLVSYKFCDVVSVSAGIADSVGPVMNDQSTHTIDQYTYRGMRRFFPVVSPDGSSSQALILQECIEKIRVPEPDCLLTNSISFLARSVTSSIFLGFPSLREGPAFAWRYVRGSTFCPEYTSLMQGCCNPSLLRPGCGSCKGRLCPSRLQ